MSMHGIPLTVCKENDYLLYFFFFKFYKLFILKHLFIYLFFIYFY